MIYPDVTVELEPPGLDEDEGDPEPSLHLVTWLKEVDGTLRSGSTIMKPDANDEEIADGWVRGMLGAAANRSPALMMAVLDRMRREVT